MTKKKELNLKKHFKNKKVLVTGHTGFKGSWLSYWLTLLGANVIGLSVSIPTNPSHFEAINLKNKIKHIKADVRNLQLLKKIFKKYQPDYVFHLAAQSLVNKSYKNPIYTWETNTLGTLNVLQSLRELKKNCVAVIITSDKSYKNLEIKRGYNEKDILGGKDPYSASKASAEIAIQSYLSSFFPHKKTKVLIGVARAGNVIGGGDWSENRLIPDCIKSTSKNKKVMIRNPGSTRPWQHVLEAIWGYLLLASNLKKNKKLHGQVFNFGPNNNNNHNVISLIKLMHKYWKKISWKTINKNKNFFYESNLLKLNSNKAKKILKWKCILTFSETIALVTDWYKKYYTHSDKIYKTSFTQIKKYEDLIKKRSI
jgi:CDP-glucose 4,6-dehydratase